MKTRTNPVETSLEDATGGRLKAVRSALWALLLILSIGIISPPASAQSTTYYYTGNAYNQFGGTFACPPVCGITGSFTVAAPLAANQISYSVTPLSFSFTDGFTTFTPSNITSSAFGVVTNSSSQIIGWNIGLLTPGDEMFSGTNPPGCAGCSVLDGSFIPNIASAEITNSPGNWRVSLYTPQQKANYAQLAEFDLQLAAINWQDYEFCLQYESSYGFSVCEYFAVSAYAYSMSGFQNMALAADPSDPNYTVIAQPTPPSLALPAPDPTWTAAQLAFSHALNSTVLTLEQLIGLDQAAITSANRAEGAYEAGNSYWEQQQFLAVSRYSDLEAFNLQVLLAELAQLKSAFPTSGFPNFTITPAQAEQFALSIAANGLPSDVQRNLTALGVSSAGLAAIAKAWASAAPDTISGDIFQVLDSLVGPIQQVIGADVTLFATFSTRVEIHRPVFELNASFVLGAGGNGIHLDTQDLSFSLGSVAVTIPAKNFVQIDSKGDYAFAGIINGVGFVATVEPTGNAGYQLQVLGSANLSNVVNPVSVAVWIGNNGGTAAVTAEISK